MERNKGADQLTAQLICVFVFAYDKSRFSYDAAHISLVAALKLKDVGYTLINVAACVSQRNLDYVILYAI